MAFFDILGTELQNIVLFNFGIFTKSFIFLLALIFSLLVLFYFDTKKDTIYLSVKLFYVVSRAFSYIFLATTIFFIPLGMNPSIGYEKIMLPFYYFFYIGLTAFAVGFLYDFYKYSILGTLEFFGINTENQKVKKFVKKWFNKNI